MADESYGVSDGRPPGRGGGAQTSDVAEAEVKLELSLEEFEQAPSLLDRLSFSLQSRDEIVDHYLERRRARSGQLDYVRVRSQGGTRFWLTRKEWSDSTRCGLVRHEREVGISASHFERLLADAEVVTTIRKTRRDYLGSIGDLRVTMSLDDIDLGREHRYFMECEATVPADQYRRARQLIRAWLRRHVGIGRPAAAESVVDILFPGDAGQDPSEP